jgi:hypothetical protein
LARPTTTDKIGAWLLRRKATWINPCRYRCRSECRGSTAPPAA